MTGTVGDRSPTGAGVAGAAAVGIVLVALHALGGDRLAAPPVSALASPDAWSSWLEQRDPATVAVFVIRSAALLVGYLLAATSALAAIGRILRRPRLVDLATAATPPPLRSTARRVAGIGLSASAVLTTPLAGASAEPPPGSATLAVAEVGAERPAPGTATLERLDPRPAPPTTTPPPTAPPSTTSPPATTPPPLPEPSPPAPPVPAEPAAVRHVVGPGDHLWSIAEHRLAQAWGRVPTDDEVDPYWRRVVAANPQVGDPDLLHVGDVVRVPPPPASPT